MITVLNCLLIPLITFLIILALVLVSWARYEHLQKKAIHDQLYPNLTKPRRHHKH